MASAAATTNWIVNIVYTQCNFFATLLSYILHTQCNFLPATRFSDSGIWPLAIKGKFLSNHVEQLITKKSCSHWSVISYQLQKKCPPQNGSLLILVRGNPFLMRKLNLFSSEQVDWLLKLGRLIFEGLPRTGTMSTYTALEMILPGKCHHMARWRMFLASWTS